MTKYYAIDKKISKWTTKLSFYPLNIVFYNTFVLYKKYKYSSFTYLDYPCGIMIDLKITTNSDTNNSETTLSIENSQRLDFNKEVLNWVQEPLLHYLEPLFKQQMCKHCSNNHLRKET